MPKFFRILRKYPQTFWVANTMELFERWAWYGLFMVFALYLTGSTESGALGFTQAQKGLMMGSVVGFLYLLPVVTGAIADRVGYKKVLIIAYTILALAYFLLGQVTSYPAVFASYLLLATGAALFKPVITACIAKTTDDETSSLV
jgi:proton-dependent oligopeptide transporter, POT family